jgi:uncharacterized membrane protein YheB (UPF0754 family)
VSESTLALLSIPLFTGAIGYLTNWTGVLMLFYPVHFRGYRSKAIASLARKLPYRLQQIPGLMIGGIGWQGIVPSRASKVGSLAVDTGIAKLGSPSDFWDQLEPEKMAEQIVAATEDELPEMVERIMLREHPRLWVDLPPRVKQLVQARVRQHFPEIVRHVTAEIGRNIDQLLDVKLMVIRRFDPELANRVFLDMGQRELTFIKNFGFFFGFVLGIPVAALTHFVTFWWLLPILGVIVGYVTNWVALWMIYEPARPRKIGPLRIHGLFIRRQHDVADVYARIVADEILTMTNFRDELLNGPRADRTRAMIETAMLPAIDRATGSARAAVRVAFGSKEYDAISRSFAAGQVEDMMVPLGDPEFNRDRSRAIRKLIRDRMREMAPEDFGEMLRTATRQDEWLLLLHGAVLGFDAGILHLVIFKALL